MTIELEISFDERDAALRISDKLLNGESNVGRKHGKWVLFIGCKSTEILHLGQELHYALDDCEPPTP